MRSIRHIALALTMGLMMLCAQNTWGQLVGIFNANYRDVFWMHGLNGNEKSLKAYALYFGQLYQINSYHHGYESTMGIDYAANQWTGFGLDRTDKNFVVTHSMGGLVARYYDQAYPNKRFGSLITIAAPHQGSEFAASFDNGKLNNFFNSILTNGLIGYREMGDGVKKEEYHKEVINYIESIAHIPGSSTKKDTIDLNELSSKIFKLDKWQTFWDHFRKKENTKSVIDNIIKKLSGMSIALVRLASQRVFSTQTAGYPSPKDELKPNSGIIQQINRTAFTGGSGDDLQHTINICCISPTTPGIKFLGSTLYAATTDAADIGAISDQKFIEFISAMNTTAWRCREKYAKRFRLGSWLSLGLTNSRFRTMRDAFEQQTNFWTTTNIESLYQNCLTKYTQTHTETWGEWVWVGYGDPTVPRPDEPEPLPWIDLQAFEQPFVDAGIQKIQPPAYETDPDDPIYPFPDGHWEWRERSRTYTTTHVHENDGIVTLPSQKGWAEAKHTVVLYGARDGGGIDHEKAKRSNEVRDLLIQIMDGKKYDTWFHTNRR